MVWVYHFNMIESITSHHAGSTPHPLLSFHTFVLVITDRTGHHLHDDRKLIKISAEDIAHGSNRLK